MKSYAPKKALFTVYHVIVHDLAEGINRREGWKRDPFLSVAFEQFLTPKQGGPNECPKGPNLEA